MKFIDLRDDKSKPAFRVVITHFIEKPNEGWRTTGAAEIFDVSTLEKAESVARGCSGKGRAVSLSHNGNDLGHYTLHSSRRVRHCPEPAMA